MCNCCPVQWCVAGRWQQKASGLQFRGVPQREYCGSAVNQNNFFWGDFLLILGFDAFLSGGDDALPILSDLP